MPNIDTLGQTVKEEFTLRVARQILLCMYVALTLDFNAI